LAIERGLAANSRAAYRRDLRRYAMYLRGRGLDDPTAIGEETVQDYVRHLGSLTDDDGQRLLAPSSIARALVAVRSFHGFCAAEGLLPTDPSEEVDAPRVPQGIPKALDEAQVEALLGAVTGNGALAQRDRALLEMLYATGIRISEAVGLELGDLDLEDGVVRVLGKGDKERIVPLGAAAQEIVQVYQRDARPVLGAGKSSPHLFIARGAKPITRQRVWQLVNAASVNAGRHVSPHMLRHSCATHMVENGADLRTVQTILGHADISTTQVYTHLALDRLSRVHRQHHPRAKSRTTAGKADNE